MRRKYQFDWHYIIRSKPDVDVIYFADLLGGFLELHLASATSDGSNHLSARVLDASTMDRYEHDLMKLQTPCPLHRETDFCKKNLSQQPTLRQSTLRQSMPRQST